jgi:tRNA G18 (ribose-2'-O)-methylase SpoU
MKQKIQTIPDISLNSEKHQTAIKTGKDFFYSRNVIDKFKSKTTEEIKTELKSTSFPFAVCFENFIGDFNFATGIRNANAFNAREVFYLGNKRFDKRGTQGSHNYIDITFIPTIDDFLSLKSRYKIIGIDNISNSVPLNSHRWEENTLVVFGSEDIGLTPTMISYCDKIVHIKQFGSIRSINVGTASGIIMNSIATQFSEAI